MISQPTEPPLSLHPSIVLVRPDSSHRHIHDQLISAEKSDKVHPISGLQELLTRRLGEEGSNKRCYAMMHGDAVHAAIYTYWATPDDADAEWKLLPSKVHQILQEPSRLLITPPKVVTFYSISSFVNGAGKDLIGGLHHAFTQQANPPILTTLSPLRTLRNWIETTGREIGDSVDKMIDVAAEYLTCQQDPVQKFHLNNGAYIAAIQAFANAAGTADDADGMGIMVNYRYPRSEEALKANQSDFRGKVSIPAASHLRELVNK